MILKLSQAIALPSFCQTIQNTKLPIRTTYKLSQLKRELEFHINFYWENLQKIMQEYADTDENGNIKTTEDGAGILIRQEFIQECTQKVNDLSNLTIEIPDIYFSISDFDNLEISMQAFEAILPFIKE